MFGQSLIETFEVSFDAIRCSKCKKVHTDSIHVTKNCMRNKKMLREEVEDGIRTYLGIEFERLVLKDKENKRIVFGMKECVYLSVEVTGFLA